MVKKSNASRCYGIHALFVQLELFERGCIVGLQRVTAHIGCGALVLAKVFKYSGWLLSTDKIDAL